MSEPRPIINRLDGTGNLVEGPNLGDGGRKRPKRSENGSSSSS